MERSRIFFGGLCKLIIGGILGNAVGSGTFGTLLGVGGGGAALNCSLDRGRVECR